MESLKTSASLEAVPDGDPGRSEHVAVALWRALDTADKGLYNAKHTGRNRVVAIT